MRRSFALLALPLLLAGCATHNDLYVLLPDAEGKSGTVVVSHGGKETVLNEPYASARVREAGKIEPASASEQEVREVFGKALAAQPARPVSFMLYFIEGSDEFTAASRKVVDQIFAEIARRPAPEVVVIGHTDRVGTLSYNDRLSLQRAERVRGELGKLGVAADSIRIAGRGEREPLVATEDEMPEPRNRRVEINVR